jgi:nucleotide-binding universal stress UspA family protein
VVSHKIRDTVLEIVNKEKANLTIIGWSGKPPRSRIMFGYNIDDIIQFAKSDVAVLRGPLKSKLDRILILPGFAHHGERTAELASYLARDYGGTITVVGLLTPDKAEVVVKQETQQFVEMIRKFGVAADEKIIRTKRPVGKLVKLAHDYDIIMMGADERWKLLRFAFGPIQDSVAKKAEVPLLLLRAYEKEEKMISTSDMGEGREEEPKPMVKAVPVPVSVPVPTVAEPAEEQVEDGEAQTGSEDQEIETSHTSQTPIVIEDSNLEEDEITYASEPTATAPGIDQLNTLEKYPGEETQEEDETGYKSGSEIENATLADVTLNTSSQIESEGPQTSPNSNKKPQIEPPVPEELEDEEPEEEEAKSSDDTSSTAYIDEDTQQSENDGLIDSNKKKIETGDNNA